MEDYERISKGLLLFLGSRKELGVKVMLQGDRSEED